jgi:hypothetical protein
MMVESGQATSTNVATSPGHIVSYLGQISLVNITVSNVANLNSWQICLSFDPRIVTCNGLFIPSDSILGSFSDYFFATTIDNVNGRVIGFCALYQNNVTSGSGKLFTINFTGYGLGVSALTFLKVGIHDIFATYLANPAGGLIAFQAVNGIFEVVGSDFQRNAYPVTQNMQTYYVIVRTNSSVANFYFSATSRELGFNATGSTGTKGACIVEVPKGLLNGSLITLMNNVGLRTYSRSLGTLPENATHTYTYFNFTHSTKNFKIRLTVVGDLNGDRKVDINDLARASAAYGSIPGSANWNPVADVDNDMKVDIRDVAIVSQNYGRVLPP